MSKVKLLTAKAIAGDETPNFTFSEFENLPNSRIRY